MCAGFHNHWSDFCDACKGQKRSRSVLFELTIRAGPRPGVIERDVRPFKLQTRYMLGNTTDVAVSFGMCLYYHLAAGADTAWLVSLGQAYFMNDGPPSRLDIRKDAGKEKK